MENEVFLTKSGQKLSISSGGYTAKDAINVEWKPISSPPDSRYRVPCGYEDRSVVLLLGHFDNGCYNASFGHYQFKEKLFHVYSHHSFRVTNWALIRFADQQMLVPQDRQKAGK